MNHPNRLCKCGCKEYFKPFRTTQLFKDMKHCKRFHGKVANKRCAAPFHYKAVGQYKNMPTEGKSLFLPTEPRPAKGQFNAASTK